MKLKEYMEKLKILQNEITGCDNLIDFYKNKKEMLKIEYENLLNMDISNRGVDDNSININ